MQKSRKNTVFSVILTVVTLLFIAFIFLHSSMTADESDGESLTVLDFLSDMFQGLGIPIQLTNHIVRKAAHFCEFCLLGVLSSLTLFSYIKKPLNNMTSACFICLATAVADETIQLFVPGRAGMVQDVLLDFSGSLTGIIFVTVILIIISVRKNKSS